MRVASKTLARYKSIGFNADKEIKYEYIRHSFGHLRSDKMASLGGSFPPPAAPKMGPSQVHNAGGACIHALSARYNGHAKRIRSSPSAQEELEGHRRLVR
jgi:hypothetical protein